MRSGLKRTTATGSPLNWLAYSRPAFLPMYAIAMRSMRWSSTFSSIVTRPFRITDLYGGLRTSTQSVTRGSRIRHLHLNELGPVRKVTSPLRYSYQIGTACGAPSGAVTATTATLGSASSRSISRLVIGIGRVLVLACDSLLRKPAFCHSLAAVEFRLALFQKCLDGFLMVLREAGERLSKRLALQRRAQVTAQREVQVRLHVAIGDRGARRDPLCVGVDFFRQRRGLYYAIHHSEFERLLGINNFRREIQLASFRRPDQLRQEVTAAEIA